VSDFWDELDSTDLPTTSQPLVHDNLIL